jgi:hypothetical protein
MRKKIVKISPEKAAKEWIDLKAQKVVLEKRIDELKQVLEPFLGKQKDRTVELKGWRFSLAEIEREYFKLAEAKQKIEHKILKPFIQISKYIQIRTSWQGGEDASDS